MKYMFDPAEVATEHTQELMVTAKEFTRDEIAMTAHMTAGFEDASEAEDHQHWLKLAGVVDGVDSYAEASAKFGEIKEAFYSKYSPEDREILSRAIAGSAISGSPHTKSSRSV